MTVPKGVLILVIVAVLSLALNLFLAGGLLGRQFHHPPPGQELESRLDALARDMSPADQAIVHDIVAQHHDALLDKWRASRAAGQEAAVALHATPFSADDSKSLLGKWTDRGLEFRNAFHDLLVEIAGKVSPDGRSHLRFGPGS